MKIHKTLLCVITPAIVACGEGGELNLLCKGTETIYMSGVNTIDKQVNQVTESYIFKNKKWNGVVDCQTWTTDDVVCERVNSQNENGSSRLSLNRVTGKLIEHSSQTFHDIKKHKSKFFDGVCEKISSNRI
jgi:hypothetical protein